MNGNNSTYNSRDLADRKHTDLNLLFFSGLESRKSAWSMHYTAELSKLIEGGILQGLASGPAVVDDEHCKISPSVFSQLIGFVVAH